MTLIYQQAIDNLNICLNIVKAMGDRNDEGIVYRQLGVKYYQLGNARQAKECLLQYLAICKETGDNVGEVTACLNLGCAYQALGELQQAIEQHKQSLLISKEVGNKMLEGLASFNLGVDYQRLGQYRQAFSFYNLSLSIARERRDMPSEGLLRCALGNTYYSLGDFDQALEHTKQGLAISKACGDESVKGRACSILGRLYQAYGDVKLAISYYNEELAIAIETGNRAQEGIAYRDLGSAHRCLGDYKQAREYHKKHLTVCKETEDRAGEGIANANLGVIYQCVADLKQAAEHQTKGLHIAKELGNKAEEGAAYANLGNTYYSLGNFKEAIQYYHQHLVICKETGDKMGEVTVYGNLGNAHLRVRDFKHAIEDFNRSLLVSRELRDRAGEGRAYGSFGCAYLELGDFKKAIEYHKKSLDVLREVNDRSGEGLANGNLGFSCACLGDFVQAQKYQRERLAIAEEIGDKSEEGWAHHGIGKCLEGLGFLGDAVGAYKVAVDILNSVRSLLQSKDEWKISLRNRYELVYASLWSCLSKQGKNLEALHVAELGRAQGLADLLMSQYGYEPCHLKACGQDMNPSDLYNCAASNTLFLAHHKESIYTWLLQERQITFFRKYQIDASFSKAFPGVNLQTALNFLYTSRTDPVADVTCEDRSLNCLVYSDDMAIAVESVSPPVLEDNLRGIKCDYDKQLLSVLYDVIIKPASNLFCGDELLIVPDGSLSLVPFAAFVDSDSEYLCDSYRIRVVPSITSLRLIQDSPSNYHRRSGALVVGDPSVEEIVDSKTGRKLLDQLPFARREAEEVGRILKVAPLTGQRATKAEVLKRLNAVALVHIAAHGRAKTGEIALAPNPGRASKIPDKEDFLLTMADVLKVGLRARLVVLSCCHSGRGDVKAEGVVGIARAFLGAGARSVLVSLWAINDEATTEFMRCFYQNLTEGKRASEALNQARNHLRKSSEFSAVKYWGPFVLIGDDVILDNYECL